VRLLFRDRLSGEINLNNMRLREDRVISLKALWAMNLIAVTTATMRKVRKTMIMRVIEGIEGGGDRNEVIPVHFKKALQI